MTSVGLRAILFDLGDTLWPDPSGDAEEAAVPMAERR